MQRVSFVLLLILALSGCALKNPAPRVAVYDFGPGPLNSAAPTPGKALPTLLLEMLEAPAALDSTAVLYRLAYADSQQLRPYTLARWSMTPSQLLRQHLRQQLGQQRALLNPGDSAGPNAAKPLLLQLELEEFSQMFESANKSTGLLRLRATLTRPETRGSQWLAQRSLTVQRSAATADAAGGVQALAAAAEAAAQELDQWLKEFER
ncbi:MAG: ABC-type transport auxiliary lipoprotein family protein [Comamonadaceae bacterium]